MRKMSAIVLTCAALLVAQTALATVPSLPNGTPVYFQFNNMEQVNANNDISIPTDSSTSSLYTGLGTMGNWGVFNVSSIQDGAVATPHVDIAGGTTDPNFLTLNQPGGPQITGIFGGINFTGPTTANGGFIDLYYHPVGNVTATQLNGGAGPTAATVDQFTTGNGGIFLGRLVFASGILSADASTFISSTSNPATLGGSGEADSFANVDPTLTGLYSAALDGNWFQTAFGTRDLRFSNFFNNTLQSTWGGLAPDGSTIFGDRSNDPGRDFTAAVPEPGSIFLLLVSLVGMFSLTRKRSK